MQDSSFLMSTQFHVLMQNSSFLIRNSSFLLTIIFISSPASISPVYFLNYKVNIFHQKTRHFSVENHHHFSFLNRKRAVLTRAASIVTIEDISHVPIKSSFSVKKSWFSLYTPQNNRDFQCRNRTPRSLHVGRTHPSAPANPGGSSLPWAHSWFSLYLPG